LNVGYDLFCGITLVNDTVLLVEGNAPSLPEAWPLQRGGNDGALPSSNRLVYPVQKITLG